MADFVQKKIRPKTLGEILREARKKKKLTLDQAEEETKVRSKYLKALEDDKFEILPGNAYALGFLGKYLDFLELNKDELLLRFKSERGESHQAGKFMVARSLSEPKLSITPKILTFLAVALAIIAIVGYILYSVRVFMLPPNLEISSPSSEQIITENQVEIIGKTDEGATLMINDQSVLPDSNGNFKQVVKLTPGLNTFHIRSINNLKKETDKEIKILAKF